MDRDILFYVLLSLRCNGQRYIVLRSIKIVGKTSELLVSMEVEANQSESTGMDLTKLF